MSTRPENPNPLIKNGLDYYIVKGNHDYETWELAVTATLLSVAKKLRERADNRPQSEWTSITRGTEYELAALLEAAAKEAKGG